MSSFFTFLVLIAIAILNVFILFSAIGFFRGAVSGAPFVPTRKKMENKMIELAGNIENKKIYDLGCGDGRIVFSASKKGAKAIGIEISFFVYWLARFRKYITQSDGKIIHGSLWDIDISDADVIFVYLLPAMMKRFENEKIPTMKKGSIIISNGFSLPNIKPQKEEKISNTEGRVLVYSIS